MNTLIYKRTHRGDPDKSGVFGIHDCMGPVRRWNFDSVVGVGGSRPWPGHEGIANRINWIGITPDKTKSRNREWRGPRVRFERFVLYDEKGPQLKRLAPKLFKYMYEDRHVRLVTSKSLTGKMQEEIKKILRLAKKHRGTKPFRSHTVLAKYKCCGRKAEKPNS
jgi:hypothetical protein